MFNAFDLKGFWKDNAESKKDFISQDVSDEEIQQCEKQLGFKLPDSYIALMKGHNGGILGRDVFQKKDANGKITKSVICEFLNAIGDEKRFSLMSD
ncbi:SMI1/KNR4 family protein [Cronobacter dublinensis]|nr:SMI1/KNR4 family protein [Cronobacter dublinensis]MDT3664876.1 SMI1/KNR4 family protein [Cronobacter dublinensis]WEP43947.1 SMI1/KNR4 family protein [Cronobacter dublinensis]